ncbi:MAG: hypothetical protein LBT97_01560 [Planctomycetota bacterium]|nr:hypothetical protein [Planctomycetota bacterium]
MGTFYGQKFFALKASGPDLKLPFDRQPFTALVDIASEKDDVILEEYAKSLISHGCVQAICRGCGAERMDGIFHRLAEEGCLDRDGVAFTSMCAEEETLHESLHYFVLPSGLASIGLVLVIGEARDFGRVVDGFNRTAGELFEMRGEPVSAYAELACYEFA